MNGASHDFTFPNTRGKKIYNRGNFPNIFFAPRAAASPFAQRKEVRKEYVRALMKQKRRFVSDALF